MMLGQRFLAGAAVWMMGAACAGAQTVQSYTTLPDLTRALAPGQKLKFTVEAKNEKTETKSIAIDVDTEARYQTMDGFGASLTDGSAWLLKDKLPSKVSSQVMRKLFDPKQGIGLSFLRQPIGATDLSRTLYSFDDVPVGQTDPDLQHFSVEHDEAYVFPVIREALRVNPAITVMATPWSPPGWMKTKNTMDGGMLRQNAMASYAQYLVRSLQAFTAQGVPVKFLTVQNEPLNETHNYPGTLMQSDQAAELIGKYLGPDLEKAGLKTKILAYDHNWDHPEYPLAILADPAAEPFVAGSALHCYGGNVAAQTTIHDSYPSKGVWMTECSGGTWQKENPLLTTTHLLIDSTRNWAKAVVLWGIALDGEHGPHDGGCGTCRGLVTIDLAASGGMPGVQYTGDYYGLGQASRFVRPGATRIGSSSQGRQGLETVAFQNQDGSIALLVLNNAAADVAFAVRWKQKSFPATVPGGAVTTFVWRP